jgi:hypothetical protein
MARIIQTLDQAISYINTLFEGDSTAPTSGEEDYTVWTGLLNIAINIWENEEGMLWRPLFIRLADSADGDKTTNDGDHSYALPALFQFPASGYVWLGAGNQKTPYKVMPIEKVQLLENDGGHWCYFTPTTLEFNPNLTIGAGSTISYNFYKYATKLATGSSTFEMTDPFFAIYYALSELKKDEGDTSALTIATQKLEAMKTRNTMPSWYEDNYMDDVNNDAGFGN